MELFTIAVFPMELIKGLYTVSDGLPMELLRGKTGEPPRDGPPAKEVWKNKGQGLRPVTIKAVRCGRLQNVIAYHLACSYAFAYERRHNAFICWKKIASISFGSFVSGVLILITSLTEVGKC